MVHPANRVGNRHYMSPFCGRRGKHRHDQKVRRDTRNAFQISTVRESEPSQRILLRRGNLNSNRLAFYRIYNKKNSRIIAELSASLQSSLRVDACLKFALHFLKGICSLPFISSTVEEITSTSLYQYCHQGFGGKYERIIQ